MKNTIGSGTLRNLPKIRKFRRKRVSSYDKTGGNKDNWTILPNEKKVIFDVDGPGCITHIWSTQSMIGARSWPRHVIIRIWWDDEEEPSVECPLGDFFGMGHGLRRNFTSLPLQMSPQNGQGMNSWWPMPFKKHARIEIENDNPNSKFLSLNRGRVKILPGMIMYFYIDYEEYDEWPEDEEPIAYFHCTFNRKDYKKDIKRDFDTGKRMRGFKWQFDGGCNTRENGGYDRNHKILEAEGEGIYCGCHINIDNRWRLNFNWPGEGDDMIWIDDDIGKEPTLYGTGTEDYVNAAYCPQQKYDAPYHGIIKGGGLNWNGKITYYRYHIEDPIKFDKTIKVTIEHGHNNLRGDIWETTAYWYQLEPHKPLPPLPSYAERMPRKDRMILKTITSIAGITIILGFLLKVANLL